MVRNVCCVDIVIATYNSNGYIREQLDSILNQSYKNIRVIIRDDGSVDNTVDIIKEFMAQDSRVVLIEDAHSSAGVGENFKKLLIHSDAEYVFLSDQDDVWLAEKVEKLLAYAEVNFDKEQPCIAYAPGVVVDEELKDLNKITNYNKKVNFLEDMFLMNGGIQGCAMVINRNLYKKALEGNFYWYMHDQVLTLYAVVFGKIFFFNEPLFLYRQHSSNVLGYNNSKVIEKVKKYLIKWKSTFLVNRQSYDLFLSFFNENAEKLSGQQKRIFITFFSLSDLSRLTRTKYILSCKFTLGGLLYRAIVKNLLCSSFIEKI